MRSNAWHSHLWDCRSIISPSSLLASSPIVFTGTSQYMDESLSSGGRVSTYQRDSWYCDPNQPLVGEGSNARQTLSRTGARGVQVGKDRGASLYLVFGCCGRMKGPVQQSLWLFNYLATGHILASSHPRILAHPHPSLVYNTPHSVNMGKEPVVMCQGTRYEPYSKSCLARRRRGSPPPDRRGIRAGSRHAQLTGGIFDLLDDLHARYGSHDLRELFRGHANQPGALGQAIQTWIQYDEVTTLLTSSSLWAAQTGVLLANSLFQIRGPRQPILTDFLETQYNTQNHCNYVPDPTPRGECRASRPPVGQLDACHVSFYTTGGV